MLTAGEEPLYLLRRLTRAAVEDIGLADPQALVQCIAAKDAYDFLGSPEGELAIVQACLYLATAPKSNAAYAAQKAAWRSAKETGSLMPPKNILNAPTKLMKSIGYGKGYRYDHDAPGSFSGDNYWPEEMEPQTFYKPVDRGFEKRIAERMAGGRSGVLNKRIKLLFLIAFAAAAPATAQNQDQTRYLRALAAGYKASFLCSDIFNAGMTERRSRRDDLKRTYPELEPLMPAMQARVDRTARMVSVTFDEKMPPRIAAWRPYLGCAQLPIGAAPGTAAASALERPAAPANMDGSLADGRPQCAGAAARDRSALGHRARPSIGAPTGKAARSTALLVVQNGRIVASAIREDSTMHMSQRTWSVAKSSPVRWSGAACRAGQDRRRRPLPPIPEWRSAGDPRAQITTDHLFGWRAAFTATPRATAPTPSISAAPASPSRRQAGRSKRRPALAFATPITTRCWRRGR
jgi:hypothetical protein